MQSLLELLHVYINVIRVDKIWHRPTVQVVLGHALLGKALLLIDLAEGRGHVKDLSCTESSYNDDLLSC